MFAAIIRSIWTPIIEWLLTPGPALGARRLQAILALPFVALLFLCDYREFTLPFPVFAGSARNQLTAFRAKWCSVVAAPDLGQRIAAPEAIRILAILAAPPLEHL